ncbi:MAG: HD domain-containing protein [Clostridia bacterium]|nr:HD domain-containing protein [Clostridia bacterium]
MNLNSNNYKEFYSIISDIATHPITQQMKNFRQHYESSCYDHCLSVAYYSFLICKKLNLDYTSIARAAMLHDLFLYDWRVKQPGRKGFHAFRHPYIAYKKASELFNLNKKEKDIIIKHMWPVTVIPPKYLESYIITLVDKYCALEEGYNYYTKKFLSKKFFRYASILLVMLFIHVP